MPIVINSFIPAAKQPEIVICPAYLHGERQQKDIQNL